MITPEHFHQHLQEWAQTHSQASPQFLQALNQQGAAAFANTTLPNRKTEAWKYTSLFNLSQLQFALPAANSSTSAPAAVSSELPQIDELNSARLVFVNGTFNAELSDALALEQVCLFSQANSEQQQLISSKLGTVYAQQHNTGHLFNDLNNAAVQEGVLIHVPKNQQLARPLHLCFITTATADPSISNARVLMVLEQGAQATVVEHYSSAVEPHACLTNALTEISIGDNAKLQHYHLQTQQNDAMHIGAVHAELLRDAQYHAFFLSLGCQLSRNDIVVNHNVGGSHSELSGVYVPQHQQVVDYHTSVEHRAAHCTSNEVFRGIMNDKAKAVFSGRIHIHRDAQKTLAELNNKNLLLTNTAEINTKPELEIYADDVKCAHGATVAQLDEQSVFYLQSRGISQREAEVMLSFGFINELLQNLPDAAIAKHLRPILAQQFGRGEDLSQHLTDEALL